MASTMTLNADGRFSTGNKLQRLGTGNLGTYATNGVAVTAKQVGLSVIEDMQIHAAGGYVFEFDKANLKIKAFRNKAPADLGASDIPLPEVANAVDLSGTTFRWQATGH